MPLVVELLLADADAELIASCKAATGRHATALADKIHLLSAQGLHDELQKQLEDANSVLRTTGSAFGILAALGTSLRIKSRRTITAADIPDMMVLCAGQDDDKFRAPDIDLQPLCSRVDEMSPKVPKTLHGCGRNPEGPVPSISGFPGSWQKEIDRPFAWWTSCIPETCRSGCSQPRVKAVVLFESRCSPELASTCEPAKLFGVSPGDVAAVYEAGSGGWPLCVPQAYAAFRPAAPPVTSIFKAQDFAVPTGLQAPVATTIILNPDDFLQTHFHRVSLEADDDEVTLLLSTASSSEGSNLPSWVRSTRVVVPRAGIIGTRQWTASEVVNCWSPDLQLSGGPLYHNWVEITCTPRNAPDAIMLLLALPSIDIAQRFHEVFSTTPRPPKPAPASKDGRRAALLCELQLLASVDLSKEGQAINCGTSMRRAICEATGIQRARVQVLSVTEGGGSLLGWAAVQWSGLQKALLPGSDYSQQRQYQLPDV